VGAALLAGPPAVGAAAVAVAADDGS